MSPSRARGLIAAAVLAVAAASAGPALARASQSFAQVTGYEAVGACVSQARAAYQNADWTDIATGDVWAKGHKGGYASFVICNQTGANRVAADIFVSYDGGDPTGSLAGAERGRLEQAMQSAMGSAPAPTAQAQPQAVDARALYDLANTYDEGPSRNPAFAVANMRRAAEIGYAPAQNDLAFMYEHADGLPKDDVQAAAWYRKAAEQGYALAQKNLGVMYAEGRGVPQDWTQARLWYEKAAAQGQAGALNNLAMMYEDGKGGLPKDYGKAASLYSDAAARGAHNAETSMGYLYEKGFGVPQDLGEAVRWYRKAAEAGQPQALSNMGVMYESGRGVPQDLVEAYKFYSLAAVQYAPGRLDRDQVTQWRDELGAKLTPDQRADAQQRVQLFIRSHPALLPPGSAGLGR